MGRGRKGKSDSLFYYKWLDKALIDLQTAKILNTFNGDYYMIAFHCQQAIEKALKGYLLFKTGRHLDGHNLTFLFRQAALIDESFNEFLEQSAQFNNYYIETRYPTDLPLEISEMQSMSILTMSENIFGIIREEIYQANRPHKIKKQ